MAIVVGMQVLTLGVVAHVFSVNSGILPPTRVSRLASGGSLLSIGLFVGIVVVLIGIFPTLYAVSLWANVDFGALDARHALRWLIPGLTLIAVGLQIFFASFILALLNFYRNWRA
jgi:hypothetical protein